MPQVRQLGGLLAGLFQSPQDVPFLALSLHEFLDDLLHDATHLGFRDPLRVRTNLMCQFGEERLVFTSDEIVHAAPSNLSWHVIGALLIAKS